MTIVKPNEGIEMKQMLIGDDDLKIMMKKKKQPEGI